MSRTSRLLLLVTGTVAAILATPSRAVSAETPYGTLDRPVEGPRYETLRSLASHLDQTARGALEGAADGSQDGTSSSEARMLSAVRSVARAADDFHRMVDDYGTSPFDVPAQVDALAARVHEVNDRIRAARVLESTYDDWDALLDVLDRMKVLLAGGDVEVPAAHVVAALSGPRLQEFRQLAHDLEISTTQAHERAKRDIGDYRDRGQQFLGELYHFRVQSRDLRRQTEAAEVHPQQMGPVVDRLLEEAREADRRMRDARVFTAVWDDSARTISTLRRMAGLVRSLSKDG